jgi:starch phosphorylase
VETRIQQEMLLGIGGVRALRAMGLRPAVCHMNEGHSSLLAVERIREVMEETGASFEEARIPVSAAMVFTTHTAVAAGIDLFPPDLVRRYLSHYYHALGLDDRAFLGLGRINADDDGEPFSMALLGLRLSGFRNAVSLLHGDVSRKLWREAWPQLPHTQVPVHHVTNGVHLPTWVSHRLGAIYDQYVGPQWRDDPTTGTDWNRIFDAPDEVLWNAHERERERLVVRARGRQRESLIRRGLASEATRGEPLDPRVLTIGFARRFAGYKRATLLFRDIERLARIVNSPTRPVQFIFAGKAHPRDDGGKHLIREVVRHSQMPEFRDRLVLLERYDMDLARSLIQGCDVWLNTPLRPLEASGTSGMKAVANGAIHASVLDGWWAEAYEPGLGWAIGRDSVEDEPETQDAFDAESLYNLLEGGLADLFYDRDADGIPRGWVAMMKRSISQSCPQFSTHRMVSDYASLAYAPATGLWLQLRRNGMEEARSLAAFLGRVSSVWGTLKVLAVEDDAPEVARRDQPVRVAVQLHRGSLTPEDFEVSMLAGEADAEGRLTPAGTTPLVLTEASPDGVCRFEGTFEPPASGRTGYAVRITPRHPALRQPEDTGLVTWA